MMHCFVWLIAPAELIFHAWTKADVATGKAVRLASMEKEGIASHKLTKKSKSLLDIPEFKEHRMSSIQSNPHHVDILT